VTLTVVLVAVGGTLVSVGTGVFVRGRGVLVGVLVGVYVRYEDHK
jgi:hypothetical protein